MARSFCSRSLLLLHLPSPVPLPPRWRDRDAPSAPVAPPRSPSPGQSAHPRRGEDRVPLRRRTSLRTTRPFLQPKHRAKRNSVSRLAPRFLPRAGMPRSSEPSGRAGGKLAGWVGRPAGGSAVGCLGSGGSALCGSPRVSQRARLPPYPAAAALPPSLPRAPAVLLSPGGYLVDPASSICLSQRLSHASLSTHGRYSETANGSLNQLWFL